MSKYDWQGNDHYLYTGIAALGTLIAVFALAWLRVGSPWTHEFAALAGVTGPFANVIGVLFGLIMAFLANDTWTAHDRAAAAVLQEADLIRGLAVLTRSMPPPERHELEAAILAYGQASLAEWPMLARRQTHPSARRDSDRLLSLVAARSTNAAVTAPVQTLMLNQVAGIRVSRDQRIGLSRTHVNPLKWLGMALLGFLTLVTVAVIHADNPRAALTAMILFGLAAVPTAAIVLIHANPFRSPNAVSSAPIAEALSPLRLPK